MVRLPLLRKTVLCGRCSQLSTQQSTKYACHSPFFVANRTRCCSPSSKQPCPSGEAQSLYSPMGLMSLAKRFVFSEHVRQSWPVREEESVQGGLGKEFSYSQERTHGRVISCFCLWRNANLYLFIHLINIYCSACVLKSKVYLLSNRKGMALKIQVSVKGTF